MPLHDAAADRERRVVVTGGAGFIGSHVAEALKQQGANVLVFDNLARGSRENLEGLSGDGELDLLQGDVRDFDHLEAMAAFHPDEVYHLAALHFIPYCNAHPQETLDVNVVGSDRLLSTLRSLPIKNLVFASSAAVYGFGEKPHAETSDLRPFDIYGMSKWVGEELLRRFHRERPDVRCVAARLSNVYGPRETNPHVLPDILSAYREGTKISLGNLWPQRDYIFVEDVAQALIAIGTGEPAWDVFNVATGVGHTVLDLVNEIQALTGTDIEVEEAPERKRSNDGHLVLDISKIREVLDWRPAYDLAGGLKNLLEWSRDGIG